jgi:hypothetical protein
MLTDAQIKAIEDKCYKARVNYVCAVEEETGRSVSEDESGCVGTTLQVAEIEELCAEVKRHRKAAQ